MTETVRLRLPVEAVDFSSRALNADILAECVQRLGAALRFRAFVHADGYHDSVFFAIDPS